MYTTYTIVVTFSNIVTITHYMHVHMAYLRVGLAGATPSVPPATSSSSSSSSVSDGDEAKATDEP